ncbi:MAG: hypothetical protein J2P17_27270 [Mycobacterium sp.]|nr:hypothetical protein [Mycobacterium sp.]
MSFVKAGAVAVAVAGAAVLGAGLAQADTSVSVHIKDPVACLKAGVPSVGASVKAGASVKVSATEKNKLASVPGCLAS